jgi:hypothetical protein
MKIASTTLLIGVFAVIATAVFAESLPQGSVLPGDQLLPSGTSQNTEQKSKMLPGDQTIPTYEIRDPQLKAAMERSRKALEDAKNMQVVGQPPQVDSQTSALQEPPENALPEAYEISGAEEALPHPEAFPTPDERPNPRPNSRRVGPRKTGLGDGAGYSDSKDGVRIFSQGLSAARSAAKETFTLPATSIALATTLYGIEATGSVERLVPAELNYAWLGPNGTVVEMKDCRLWIAVRGDYSTERIYGRSQSISCRAPTGETFDIPLEAHMVDQKEEYLGARGTLVARGKALASALSFLSDGVKAFGSAMASAQVNTEVTSGGALGEPVKGSNVGGDHNKYITGQTLSGSSAKFLDWWIDYYQSLSPTIAIGPGKKIYLALQRTIQIPKIFFGERLTARQADAISLSQSSEDSEFAEAGPKINTSYAVKSSGAGAGARNVNGVFNDGEDKQ